MASIKYSKGGAAATMLMPWIIMVAVALIIIEFLMVVITSFAMMYTDNQAAAMTLLPAILNSADCAPNTNTSFKNILATGIATGKTHLTDSFILEYGNAVDKPLPEHAFSAAYCLNNISRSMNLAFICDSKNSNPWSADVCAGGHANFKYNFYVSYWDCSGGACAVKKAYELYDTTRSGKVVEMSKIALPDGTVATVFLER